MRFFFALWLCCGIFLFVSIIFFFWMRHVCVFQHIFVMMYDIDKFKFYSEVGLSFLHDRVIFFSIFFHFFCCAFVYGFLLHFPTGRVDFECVRTTSTDAYTECTTTSPAECEFRNARDFEAGEGTSRTTTTTATFTAGDWCFDFGEPGSPCFRARGRFCVRRRRGVWIGPYFLQRRGDLTCHVFVLFSARFCPLFCIILTNFWAKFSYL